MERLKSHSYRGRIKAVILDWAGTTVDFGSFAPTAVFLRLFQSRGVPVTIEQARAPMGLMKRDHLKAILTMPEVSHRWKERYGKEAGEAEIDAMFKDFTPMQLACLSEYAGLIPGLLEAVAEYRRRGLKIGSTTGYTREMMDVLLPEVIKRGYEPDACVCPSDVPAGRPYPWMCFQNAIQLQIYPLEAFVKIGDTLPDIEEGLNAGMWTIGLALTGNMLGLNQAELEYLSPAALQAKRAEIQARFFEAGAHYVVDGIGDTPGVFDEIDRKLASGDKP
jgi:phosphonoacetaldehyde hydrolase